MMVENKLSAPIHLSRFLLSDFTHIARSYANLLEQKKAITEKSLTPTGLTLNNNMAAVLLFCNANMATPL